VYVVLNIEPAVHPTCLLYKPREDISVVDVILFRRIYLLVNIVDITGWVR
jgi:hypothetical protein